MARVDKSLIHVMKYNQAFDMETIYSHDYRISANAYRIKEWKQVTNKDSVKEKQYLLLMAFKLLFFFYQSLQTIMEYKFFAIQY